jgi:hypothetical protein
MIKEFCEKYVKENDFHFLDLDDFDKQEDYFEAMKRNKNLANTVGWVIDVYVLPEISKLKQEEQSLVGYLSNCNKMLADFSITDTLKQDILLKMEMKNFQLKNVKNSLKFYNDKLLQMKEIDNGKKIVPQEVLEYINNEEVQIIKKYKTLKKKNYKLRTDREKIMDEIETLKDKLEKLDKQIIEQRPEVICEENWKLLNYKYQYTLNAKHFILYKLEELSSKKEGD